LNEDFQRIKRLPPYVFNIVNELKAAARARGEDIIDFGMGNPDQPTPKHLAMATVAPGDAVLVPNPSYPIHPYGFVIAGADIHYVPLTPNVDFFGELEKAIKDSWPKPKMLVISFPGNPTTQCVELDFFEKVVAIAREHPGAKEIAVEFYSLSKTYNMPGWRVGFMCGNPTLVGALQRIKSYMDYGMFTPIQVAAVSALDGDQSVVDDIRDMYKSRRDTLCNGLKSLFVWAKIPPAFADMGSLEFSKLMLQDAKVAVSPGIGFGDYGDDHVRFSLIENEHRTRQAIRGIREMFRKHASEQ